MVVDPPGHLGKIRVLEIYDRVFVAIEEAWRPRLGGAMGHPREAKFRCRLECFLVKTVDKCSGGGRIKTTVVEAEPDAGHILRTVPFVFACAVKAGTKPFRV